MSKKLTKTIILIVFVVFLGINKVEASLKCKYQPSKDDTTVVVNLEISDSGDIETLKAQGTVGTGKKSVEKLGRRENWTSDKGYTTDYPFWGKQYFENNGACPPTLIVKKGWWYEYVAFSDNVNSHISTIKDKLDAKDKDSSVLSLIYYSSDSSSGGGLTDGKKMTSISCSCGGYIDDVSFVSDFDVNPGDISKAIVIQSKLFNDSSTSVAIDNWSAKLDNIASGYSYFNDTYTAKMVCPSKLVIAHKKGPFGGDHTNAFLAYNNSDAVKKDVATKYSDRTVYAISCSARKKDDSNYGSSSGSSSGSTEETLSPEISVNVGTLNNTMGVYNCGHGLLTDIPATIINLLHIFYNFLQFLVPIVIIILGTLDLLKAVASQKEDEIKKGQTTFFKRLVGAVLVFFVFAIIKLLVSVVSLNSTGIIECVDCFLKGASEGSEEGSCDYIEA